MSQVRPQYASRDLPLMKQEWKAIHCDAWKLSYANKWNVALYLATVILAGHVGGGSAIAF